MALSDQDLVAVYRPSDAKNYKASIADIAARMPTPATVNDSTIFITAAGSLTGGGQFTTNDSTDVEITLTGPDVSGFLDAPTTDGSFVVVQAGDTTSYSDTVDGGIYAE
mgnify:CR=1 FL=1